MKKIIILDFNSGTVHIHNYDSNLYPEAEDYVLELGYQLGNIDYMVSADEELEITYH